MELELQERKIAMEEERFQMEKKGNESRMKLEAEEGGLMLRMMKEKLGFN